jgi:hypothetical protein
MPFKGVLKQGVEFSVTVDNTNNQPGEATGITILKINRRDKINSADHSTVDGGQIGALKAIAEARIDRVMIFVNPTFGKVAPVTVTQGAAGAFQDPGAGDCTLVFDTIV